MITAAAGGVVEAATAIPTSAAALSAGGGSMSLARSDAGSCSETVSDISNSTSTPVNVFLVIDTASAS
jgi:hypothetical protein